MRRFLIAYAASGVLFVAIDLLWLSLVMSKLFKAEMPQLILDQPKLGHRVGHGAVGCGRRGRVFCGSILGRSLAQSRPVVLNVFP